MVHAGAGSQVSGVAEFVGGHSRIAGNLDRTHPRLRSAVHMERNIDQLLVGVRSELLCNYRRVKAVQSQRNAHLLNREVEFGRRIAGARVELAGALKLCIHVCAFGSLHCNNPDESARCSAEDQGYAVLHTRSLYFNGFKEAGGIELAQAPFQFFRAERCPHRLCQMIGQRVKAADCNPFE